jgi:hypothetical protein
VTDAYPLDPKCAICGRDITNKGQIAYAGDFPEWLHITAPGETKPDHEARLADE